MDSSKTLMKEKLEFYGIIKEAFKLPFKNPNVIICFLITFFSFFCVFLLNEIVFQHNLIQALKFVIHPPCPEAEFDWWQCYYYWEPLHAFLELIRKVSPKHILSALLFLGIVHLVDLLNTIITVYTASMIYSEDQSRINLKEIISRTVNKVNFKGPLITSIYALLLASLSLIGLLSLSINIYVTKIPFFKLSFGVLFIALLTKYIEWSAVWKMGLVISIMEENKHGDVAIGVSAYLSRGSRKRGFFLQLVFLAWSLALRILCIFVGWQKGGSKNMIEIIAAQACLDCFGNVIKWVGFMIYFYDCKKRFLEKKFDGGAVGGA